MLKKTVGNKLRDFLYGERENAAVEFVKWLNDNYHILPDESDIQQLYKDFIKLNPDKLTNDYLRKHKTI